LKSGGKQKQIRKKRKFELGRQPAMTRLGPKRIHLVRCRFAIMKHRALRLETGNFSWPTMGMSTKTRILNVVYNASNNELVRTNTLVKNSIVLVDAAPFRQWYLQHTGVDLAKKGLVSSTAAAPAPVPAKKAAPAAAGKKKAAAAAATPAAAETKELSKAVKAKHARRLREHKMEEALSEQFTAGKILAAISSRPGQIGRADGYLLEGEELEFYMKKLDKKKKTK
jgi:small subunit ribosomal protein S8e